MSRIIDLSISVPVDVNKAIEQSIGNRATFFKMLEKLESMTLLPNLKEISNAYDTSDYLTIKNKAHNLKGASGYIGAGPIHYCCYFIQDHFNNENYESQLAYYPCLIEAVLDYLHYSRKIIAENKGKCNYAKG